MQKRLFIGILKMNSPAGLFTIARISLFVFCLIVITSLAIGQVNKAPIEVIITKNPFKFKIVDSDKKITLLESFGDVTVKSLKNNIPYKKKPYLRWKPGSLLSNKSACKVLNETEKDGWKIYQLGSASGNPVLTFRNQLTDRGVLKLEFAEISPITENENQHSRIILNLKSDTSDSYFGMGMRYDQCNHSGTIVTNWCNEVGENLPTVAKNKTDEGRDITYAPVPFFVNLKGYGLLLNSFYYSEFDFAKTDKSKLKITNNTSSLNIELFLGKTPFDIVSSYYNSTGHYSKPRPWVFGVWAAAAADWHTKKIGEEINYSVLKKCRENMIPLSAIFAEDWYWAFFKFPPLDTWELNRDEYPSYERMIEDQHKQGVKHISYFLPYLTENLLIGESQVFKEAQNEGVLTKNRKGEPIAFDFSVWQNYQLDVTKPKAVDWFSKKFFEQSKKWGCDGWMNDFGEYTPYNSISFNGELGLTMHNKYPLLWAKMAKDFWDKSQPNGDYCFFSRSGYFGQLNNSAFIFTGDRNATYDPLSGLGGQITGVLNGSISAHPNISVDIGAYNCEDTKPMGKLMMFRWIELGSLIPVMRLHRGLPLCNHWRFDQDNETLQQWKKYATLHAQLFPYIYTIAQQAEDKGLPMVRHLAFYNPTDKIAAAQDFEFLLGDRILSAPVIFEKIPESQSEMSIAVDSTKVYLPEGNWYHYWTNKIYKGKGYCTVSARPGFLPFFIKEGTIIPLFDKPIDTFVEGVEDPQINDFEEANKSIEIRFYGYGKDTLTLWDGTIIECSREKGKEGIYKVTNDHGRTFKAVFID